MLDLSKNIVLCDTSYMVFYKYYALVTWYKMSERNMEDLQKPELPVDFLEKYKKTFLETVQSWSKKYNVPLQNIVFVRDCAREEIWRMALYPTYKSTRCDKKNTFNSAIFTYTYQTILPLLKEQHTIQHMCVPRLEADDCAALAVKFLRERCHYEKEITIITNDNDYVQLHKYNAQLINLQGKSLYDRIDDVGTYLHLKQIMGDVSDNIASIAPKVGPKTAMKYIKDAALLEKQLAKPDVYERYMLNKTLVDFDEIPMYLQEQFNELFQTCINSGD